MVSLTVCMNSVASQVTTSTHCFFDHYQSKSTSEIWKSAMTHTQSIYPILLFVRAISSNKTYYFYMFIEYCVNCTVSMLVYLNV